MKNGPFPIQGAILRAWGKTINDLANEPYPEYQNDQKKFLEHKNRLDDIGSMVLFGIVCKAKTIMQAEILDATTFQFDQPEDDQANKRYRDKKRTDIKRRADALEYFGVIDRVYRSKVAPEFSLTDKGGGLQDIFNENYAKEVSKL